VVGASNRRQSCRESSGAGATAPEIIRCGSGAAPASRESAEASFDSYLADRVALPPSLVCPIRAEWERALASGAGLARAGRWPACGVRRLGCFQCGRVDERKWASGPDDCLFITLSVERPSGGSPKAPVRMSPIERCASRSEHWLARIKRPQAGGSCWRRIQPAIVAIRPRCTIVSHCRGGRS
jgi:hypothetical protein